MCNCRETIEAKVLEAFKKEAPEAKDHKVEISGYVFILEPVIETRQTCQVERSASFPLKKGGSRIIRRPLNLMFSNCPFCGEEISKGKSNG